MTGILASEFRAVEKGSLKGFVVLTLPSGMALRDCAVMNTGGKLWVGLPSKPQLDREGRHRTDANGKRLYTAVVEFIDKEARQRFQDAAMAAVQLLLGVQP